MDSTLSVTALRTGLDGFVESSRGEGVRLNEKYPNNEDSCSVEGNASSHQDKGNTSVADGDFFRETSAPVNVERDSAQQGNEYSSSFPFVYEEERIFPESCSEEILENCAAPDVETSDSTGTPPSFSPNYLSPLLSPQLKPSSLPSHDHFRRPQSVPVLLVNDEQRTQNSNVFSSSNNIGSSFLSDRIEKDSKEDGIGLSGLSPSCDRRYEDTELSAKKSKAIQPIGTKQSSRSGFAKNGQGSPSSFYVESTFESNNISPKRTQGNISEDYLSIQRFNSEASGLLSHREEQVRSFRDLHISPYLPFESPSLGAPVVEESRSLGGFYDESQRNFFSSPNFNAVASDSLFRSSSLSALERRGHSVSSAPSSLKVEDSSYFSNWRQRRSCFPQTGLCNERYGSSYEDIVSDFGNLECAGDVKDISRAFSNTCSQYSSPRTTSSLADSNTVRSSYSCNEYSPGHIRPLNSESPSRTILVKNIPPGVDDSELRCLLERFGPLRDLGAQQRSRGGRGAIQATYFDLRHAREAVNSLPKLAFHGRPLDARFILSTETVDSMKKGLGSTVSQFNNGTLVVFNLDPSITADELRRVFGVYGDIKEIRESPHKRHHKFIEFYDVRDAERALHKLNKTEVSGRKIKIEISRPGGLRSHIMNDSPSPGLNYAFSSSSNNILEEESSSDSFSGMLSYTNAQGFGEYSSPLHSLMVEGASASERIAPESYYLSSSRSTPIPSSLSNSFTARDIVKHSPRSLSSPMFLASHSPHRTTGEVSALESPAGSVSSNGMLSSRKSSSEDRSKFTLYVEKVRSGEDTRTALMIRNIPNKYNQRMLLATLEENNRGKFDFFYLPIDFKNRCNVGYAFINFRHPQYIIPFYFEFHGRRWGRFNSEKICEITYARIQGRNNLIAHFQNSSLMNEDPKCRPIIFGENGERLEFPVGPHVRTRRGPNSREISLNREMTLLEESNTQ
jgi:RNA recognition motif-containing protein